MSYRQKAGAGEPRKGTIKPVGAKMQKPPMKQKQKDAISGGKLLTSQAPRTRALRKSVIEDDLGNVPIR